MHLKNPRCSCLATLWLFLLLQSAKAYTPTMSTAARQLSPSVLLMGEFDWKLYTGSDGKPWSRCLDMVWRARKYSSGDRLNIVPTHHWLPNNNGLGVASFCYMHTSGEGDAGTCLAWTADKLAEFKKSMTLCFTEALKQGFVPYVRPHVDDGLHRGIWRNSLLFSPTTKYGGYSWADVMVTPLAEAMRDAITKAAALGDLYAPPEASRPVVYMAMQGEMSATLMRYTSDWATLVPTIKDTIGENLADVKVGVGLNFNALDAVECVNQGLTATGIFGALLGAATTCTNAAAPSIQAAAVKDMLSNKLDFLGISAYAPFSGANFAISEFQNAAFNVADALSSLAGLSLASLINAGKLELHYSEFGIGGGVNGLAQIAASADEAAKQPWAGITGSFTTGLNPWLQSSLSSFRTSFYTKALSWLSNPRSGTTYLVNEVFVWSMSSWDLFGIYPDSSSAAGSYRDLSVVNKIAAHNSAVIAAQICALQGSTACSVHAKANAACLSDASGAACLNRPSTGATPTNPDVVTEAGPSNSSPAPGASGTSTSDQPATEPGSMYTGTNTAIEMSPGSNTAASPAPVMMETGSASDTALIAAKAAARTKSSAAGRKLIWALSVVLPGLCATMMVL